MKQVQSVSHKSKLSCITRTTIANRALRPIWVDSIFSE